MDGKKKLRLWLGIPTLILFIAILLNALTLFAGSGNGSMVKEAPVFTLKGNGFHSVYMQTTCEGNLEPGKGGGIAVGKITSCKKDSALNPMRWISIFYYSALISGGFGFLAMLMIVAKPGEKWINWSLIFTGGAVFIQAFGSTLVYGIVDSAQRLMKFEGGSNNVDPTAGMMFMAITWSSAGLFLLGCWVLLFFRRHINKHPELGMSSGSGGSLGLSMPSTLSRRDDQEMGGMKKPAMAHHSKADEVYAGGAAGYGGSAAGRGGHGAQSGGYPSSPYQSGGGGATNGGSGPAAYGETSDPFTDDAYPLDSSAGLTPYRSPYVRQT